MELIEEDGEKVGVLNFPLYPGISVIVGKYGTGKSLLLNSIGKYLQEEEKTAIEIYSGRNNESDFKKIIDIYSRSSMEKIQKNNIELIEIKKYTLNDSLNKDLFRGKKAIKGIQDLIKNLKTSKVQNFSSWNNLEVSEDLIEQANIKEDSFLNKINSLKNEIEEYKLWAPVSIKYKENIIQFVDRSDNFKNYDDLINEVKKLNIEKSNEKLFKIRHKRRKANFILNLIKAAQEVVVKRRGEISRPKDLSLYEYYLEKEKISRDFEKILNLNSEYSFVYNLGFISEEEHFQVENHFIKGMNMNETGYHAGNDLMKRKKEIFELWKFVRNISEFLYDKNFYNTFYSGIKSHFEKLLKEKSDLDVHHLYISKVRFLLNGELLKGEPSTGQKKLLCISNYLNQDFEFFLLDEPEAFLDLHTTNNIILTRIQELSKLGKKIILSTHNSNLAILSRPASIFYRIYDFAENSYQTYFGNIYSGYFKNLETLEEVFNVPKELKKILEGGEEPFIERINYYGKISD